MSPSYTPIDDGGGIQQYLDELAGVNGVSVLNHSTEDPRIAVSYDRGRWVDLKRQLTLNYRLKDEIVGADETQIMLRPR